MNVRDMAVSIIHERSEVYIACRSRQDFRTLSRVVKTPDTRHPWPIVSRFKKKKLDTSGSQPCAPRDLVHHDADTRPLPGPFHDPRDQCGPQHPIASALARMLP
nr:hypothetical protein CFP56_01024 [Quercus suber]